MSGDPPALLTRCRIFGHSQSVRLMSNYRRNSRRAVPTTAEAVDFFLAHCEGQKSVKDHISVLRGTDGRRRGRKPAGPALAKSHIGAEPLNRTTEQDFTRWFNQRHPDDLAPSTKKRGMSTMATFLDYCFSQGWVDASVLAAKRHMPASEPAREWLHPEQVQALQPIIYSDEFDEYERFAWEAYISTGMRAFELPQARAKDLSHRSKLLHVPEGKGRGRGKSRDIPTDQTFRDRWRAHIERYGLGPNDYMFFSRQPKFVEGSHREVEKVSDITRPASDQVFRRMMVRVREEVVAAARRGEFDMELVPEFGITPKVLRRTFACNQLILSRIGKGGLDLLELQECMGHTRLDVTRIYLSDVHRYLGQMVEYVNTQDAADLIMAWKHQQGQRRDAS
ncbi:MAG TPA: site-specific integrase [Solirubrobacteraceae bacterium]|jgi:integrase